MQMTFRWFGLNNDSVSLNQIKQIPQVEGIVWSLHNKVAGDKWTRDEIFNEKKLIESYGFNIDVVESVNVHEDIKLGLPSRDKYIEIYIDTIRLLAEAGVSVICYNFMPVFDWFRSDLAMPLPDGSNALAYNPKLIDGKNCHDIVKAIADGSLGYTLPGWEPERLEKLTQTLDAYQNVTEEILWANLEYFLKAIIPVAESVGIKMAIHPDDPPWSIFGLPRIMTCEKNLKRLVNLVESPSNGLTLCTGSLGASPANDMPKIIESLISHIHFLHIRNVKREDDGLFYEVSHRTQDGHINITEIIKILYKNNYKGYVRPDHGRMIWDEHARPGYGLYDRALGIMYIWGLWDAYRNK